MFQFYTTEITPNRNDTQLQKLSKNFSGAFKEFLDLEPSRHFKTSFKVFLYPAVFRNAESAIKNPVILDVVTQQLPKHWSSKYQISNFVSELTICKNVLGEQFYTVQIAAKKPPLCMLEITLPSVKCSRLCLCTRLLMESATVDFFLNLQKSQFGHSEHEASTTQNGIFQLATHTITN